MRDITTQKQLELAHVCHLAIKNQELVSTLLDMGWVYDAKRYMALDADFARLYALTCLRSSSVSGSASNVKYSEKFDPSQPRVPAGHPDGGQWTDDPRWGDSVRMEAVEDTTPNIQPEPYDGDPDLPIEPVYPLENILVAFSGLQALNALRSMAAAKIAAHQSNKRVREAQEAVEDYLGGPGTYKPSNAGDMIVQRGNKQVRFDIKGKQPHNKPHFHLLKQRPNGKWRPAEKGKLRYDFKE